MNRTGLSPERICVTVLLLAFVSVHALAQTPQHEPHTFLQKYLNFTPSDLKNLEDGQVVTKLPKASERQEIATFGIVRVNASPEILVTQFRDIVSFKKSASVLQIGKFSHPPRLEDLRALTLDEAELAAIKNCRIGNCDVKLPAEIITRFQQEVKWTAPRYREQADRLIRQMLIDYVHKYLAGGTDALSDYHDKPSPVRRADEFRALLRQSPYVYEYAPEFHQYLEQFPHGRLAGTEDFIYWSKEKFGLKPTLSLTHVTIYKRNGANTVMIASRQIYASHYFEASLGLTAFAIERGGTGAPASYLMYLNRSRIDALRGSFGGLKRSMIAGELRGATEKNLRLTKQRLETSVTASR